MGKRGETALRLSTTARSSGFEVLGPLRPLLAPQTGYCPWASSSAGGSGRCSRRYFSGRLPLTLFHLFFAFGPSRSCLSPFHNLGFLLPDKNLCV